MSPTRLFIDQALECGAQVELEGDRARYVGKVLRLARGDTVILFDGSGDEFEAMISDFGRGRVYLHVAARRTPAVESPLDVHLLQGVSRGERMDFVVQKATELGVRRITPVLTEYSVVKLDAGRREKRRLHWQNVATSACEQSGRTRPPAIDAPDGLRETLGGLDAGTASRIVLEPRASRFIAEIAEPSQGVVLLVGPEGGFSETELELADACGFEALGFGPRILRTETAAIAALAALQTLYGDVGRR